MWLLYVTAARLGGGGMFDQCVYSMSLLQDLVEGGMFDQCGNSMSLLQDFVEGACLISVVTICRCCKTWWRGHV